MTSGYFNGSMCVWLIGKKESPLHLQGAFVVSEYPLSVRSDLDYPSCSNNQDYNGDDENCANADDDPEQIIRDYLYRSR